MHKQNKTKQNVPNRNIFIDYIILKGFGKRHNEA